MKDTCEKENCPVFKKLRLKEENECPHYMESWWKAENEKEPKMIKDCCNKRLFMMIQNLSNRLEGVQKSQEQMRNSSEMFTSNLRKAILFIKEENEKLLNAK